jgi:hypothetical protein
MSSSRLFSYIKRKSWLWATVVAISLGSFLFTCSEPRPYDRFFSNAIQVKSHDVLDITTDTLVWTSGVPEFPNQEPYTVIIDDGFTFKKKYFRYTLGRYHGEKEKSTIRSEDGTDVYNYRWVPDQGFSEVSPNDPEIVINGFQFNFWYANHDLISRPVSYVKYSADGYRLTTEIVESPPDPTDTEIEDGVYIWQVVGYSYEIGEPLLVCGVAIPGSNRLSGNRRLDEMMLMISEHDYDETLNRLRKRARFERAMYNFFQCACNCMDRVNDMSQ